MIHTHQYHLQKVTHLVSDFPHVETRFVNDGYDTLVLLLHQVTNDLVVEILNVLPSNTFPLVLLLLLL